MTVPERLKGCSNLVSAGFQRRRPASLLGLLVLVVTFVASTTTTSLAAAPYDYD
jgi:hypothetical protein